MSDPGSAISLQSLSSEAVTAQQEREALIEALATGQLRFHQLPAYLSGREKAEVRRLALEKRSGASLENTGRYTFDAERASRQNCENLIGVAQVPVGVIGPLRLDGEYVHDEELFVPLATTEGALIASTNRGCRALRESGGAVVRVDDVGITRAPVFRTSGIRQTRELIAWLEANEDEIRRRAEAGSRFLKLVEIRPSAMGTTVFIRFRFNSGDAMGMNMATIACERVVEEFIEPETGVECVSLSGNFCVDKKPSAVNFQEGRGKRIFAEVQLDKHVLEKVLKTSARALVEVQYRKNLLGSIAAGSMGFNAHFANILASFFIATGQDPAQVGESSVGVTCIEPRGPEGIVMSVYLPDVPLAAIGGGTGLETQREALALLGIEPDAERPGAAVMRLAEILGATVLAGELSLMAALTSRDLARAHEQLGRSRATS
ncbi:MAG: hydroxymethylglutaryl-CoA reductase (NADPH) [bacterium]|nr:hydroxymethylglutaryl-CoA reductase (NADPH) [bacterium]